VRLAIDHVRANPQLAMMSPPQTPASDSHTASNSFPTHSNASDQSGRPAAASTSSTPTATSTISVMPPMPGERGLGPMGSMTMQQMQMMILAQVAASMNPANVPLCYTIGGASSLVQGMDVLLGTNLNNNSNNNNPGNNQGGGQRQSGQPMMVPPGHISVVLFKSNVSRVPTTKLCDIPVDMPEPVIKASPNGTNSNTSSSRDCKDVSTPPEPVRLKILRKPTASPPAGGDSSGDTPMNNPTVALSEALSLEEREANYARERARIWALQHDGTDITDQDLTAAAAAELTATNNNTSNNNMMRRSSSQDGSNNDPNDQASNEAADAAADALQRKRLALEKQAKAAAVLAAIAPSMDEHVPDSDDEHDNNTANTNNDTNVAIGASAAPTQMQRTNSGGNPKKGRRNNNNNNDTTSGGGGSGGGKKKWLSSNMAALDSDQHLYNRSAYGPLTNRKYPPFQPSPSPPLPTTIQPPVLSFGNPSSMPANVGMTMGSVVMATPVMGSSGPYSSSPSSLPAPFTSMPNTNPLPSNVNSFQLQQQQQQPAITSGAPFIPQPSSSPTSMSGMHGFPMNTSGPYTGLQMNPNSYGPQSRHNNAQAQPRGGGGNQRLNAQHAQLHFHQANVMPAGAAAVGVSGRAAAPPRYSMHGPTPIATNTAPFSGTMDSSVTSSMVSSSHVPTSSSPPSTSPSTVTMAASGPMGILSHPPPAGVTGISMVPYQQVYQYQSQQSRAAAGRGRGAGRSTQQIDFSQQPFYPQQQQQQPQLPSSYAFTTPLHGQSGILPVANVTNNVHARGRARNNQTTATLHFGNGPQQQPHTGGGSGGGRGRGSHGNGGQRGLVSSLSSDSVTMMTRSASTTVPSSSPQSASISTPANHQVFTPPTSAASRKKLNANAAEFSFAH
jgi:hypothetical protein